ncbi:hypothetical protein TeGR_g1643 [Tetraparma gracilis]|uniref:Uncharacterized protein n=1 Tax=Tetraparma gracilis TaxID=2962635 RepID=A0ABQ6MDP0_9STRA|nr:hypothetical protein TeGR_g1643 [Tetraparma gracilis]
MFSLPPPLPGFPSYPSSGPLPNADSGAFVLSRSGPPTLPELSDSNLLKILHFPPSTANVTTDLEVNTLVWKALGYRHVDGEWDGAAAFPNFRSKYPEPPDFIGMQRVYSKEVDGPCLKANQALCKTIPVRWKQSLKDNFRQYGFTGFKLAQLTPNLTRRAQCANWLLYYREELFGKTVEQLRKEREEREERERGEREEAGGGGKGWSPPINPVA